MTDQVKKWEDALKEKIELKKQLDNSLNQVTAEIFQLQGGLQFAKESAELPTGNIEVTTEEAPQP